MKNRKLTRVFTALLCAVLVMMVFPITASADTGPKPSVRITFENLGDKECWGTLLSSKQSTGPSSAWNGKEEDAKEFLKGCLLCGKCTMVCPRAINTRHLILSILKIY